MARITSRLARLTKNVELDMGLNVLLYLGIFGLVTSVVAFLFFLMLETFLR